VHSTGTGGGGGGGLFLLKFFHLLQMILLGGGGGGGGDAISCQLFDCLQSTCSRRSSKIVVFGQYFIENYCSFENIHIIYYFVL
jgi:hypothetical protein